MAIAYYVLDTETTGIKHDFHDLIEISVIRFSDKTQISRIVRADRPQNASFDALRITGKTMRDLYHGIDKVQMVAEVNAFFEEDGLTPAHRCIVAHNAPFDRKFLHHTWTRCAKEFPAELWLDTLTLCRRQAAPLIAKAKEDGTKKPELNLHAACDLFGVRKIAQAHNARDDSRNTYLLLKKFIAEEVKFADLIKRIPHNQDDE
jgi:DNA polymerase III epsilon subunit-like protein